jgi:hypothetical protein
MASQWQAAEADRTWPRTLAAVLVGLAGCLVIWVWTPYNNFVLATAFISDSYLPIAALFLILLAVLVVNPALRRWAPALALRGWQLALVLGMMLVATVLPGQGLLRMLPYAIAKVPLEVSGKRVLAEGYEAMDLPPSLFPDRLGYGARTPASEYFITELAPGESVPWGAWVGPLLSWGAFLLAGWLMMVGLAMICLPQWRRNERLAFPLLGLEQSLIQEPEAGQLWAPLFRERRFWIAAAAILLVHLLAGLEKYYPESVPAVPLAWDLRRLFTEEPLRHLPSHIYRGRLYFIFVGVAFFMPSRIGFSIWFFALAHAAYEMVSKAYAPPYHWMAVADQRAGAMVALAVGVLWLGRSHWAHVLGCLVRPAASDADRRDRRAAAMVLGGAAGMVAWMVWIGMHPGWALFYTAFGFVLCLITMRVVAETGVPCFRMDTGYRVAFIKLAPFSWLGPVSLWFGAVMTMLYNIASRVNASTMAVHALALDEHLPPRRQSRRGLALVGLLVAGLVICGAVHLYASYHHSVSLDGREQPVSRWGTARFQQGHADLIAWKSGYVSRGVHREWGHIGFGAGLATALLAACLLSPRWPLHPIGLLMVQTFYGMEAWASIFVGWLVKEVLVRYGGARLYRLARPVFLGLIMGEVFAAVVWAVVPGVLVLLGKPYVLVQVQPF